MATFKFFGGNVIRQPWTRVLAWGLSIVLSAGVFYGFLNFQDRLNVAEDSGSLAELTGSWESRWGESPANDSGEPQWAKEPIGTPGWEPIEPRRLAPKRTQTNHFWIRTKLPKFDLEKASLFLGRSYLEYEVWLDGRKIGARGDMAHPGRQRIKGLFYGLYDLPDDYAGKTLVLHFYSDYNKIGTGVVPKIGNRASLLMDLVIHQVPGVVAALVMILVGLFPIAIHLFWHRVIVAFWFGMWCITYGTGLLILNESSVYWGFSPALKEFLYTPVFAGGQIIWMRMIRSPDPTANSPLLKYAEWSAISVLLFSFLSYLGNLIEIVPNSIFYMGRYTIWFQFFFSFLASTWATYFQWRRGSLETVSLAGLLVMWPLLIYEALIAFRFIVGHSILHIGGIAVVFAMSLSMIRMIFSIRSNLHLASQELKAQYEQRIALMQDIHDGIGGMITNVKLMADTRKRISGQDILKSISDIAGTAVTELQMLTRSLDDMDLDWISLMAEMRRHARNLLEPQDILLQFTDQLEQQEPRPNSLIYMNLFRILNEALTNVVKHSGAKKVEIAFTVSGGKVTLKVQDNGVGIPTPPARNSGLRNIKTRVQQLQGEFTMVSTEGTCLQVDLPLPAQHWETEEVFSNS